MSVTFSDIPYNELAKSSDINDRMNALKTQTNTNETDISTNVSAIATKADQSSLDAEESARIVGDSNLQSQVNVKVEQSDYDDHINDVSQKHDASGINSTGGNVQQHIDGINQQHTSTDVINGSSEPGTTTSDALNSLKAKYDTLISSGSFDEYLGVYSVSDNLNTDAYSVTVAGVTLQAGLKASLTVANVNTGSSTLSWNGTVDSIKKKQFNSTTKLELERGDLFGLQFIEFDGTDWILQDRTSPATLTDADVISPKTYSLSVEGGVTTKRTGETLYNEVVNGNFSDGTNGFLGVNATLSIVGDDLAITGNGGSQSPYVQQHPDKYFPVRSGDELFVKTSVVVDNPDAISVQVLHVSSGDIDTIETVLNPEQGKVYEIYSIITKDNSVDSFIQIQTNYADATTANGKITKVIGESGIIVNNMTTLGIESYSEEKMKYLVENGYFSGIGNVSAVIKEKVIGKNLFDGIFGNKTYESDVYVAGYDYYKYKFEPNTDYNLSAERLSSSTQTDLYLVSADGGTVVTVISSALGAQTGSGSIQSDSNGEFYLAIYRATTSEYDVSLKDVMLEKGTAKTDYVLHQESTRMVDLSEYTDYLKRVQDGTVDVVDMNAKVFTKNIDDVYTIVGADIDSLVTTGTNTDYVTFQLSNVPKAIAGTGSVLGYALLNGYFESDIANRDTLASAGSFVYGTTQISIVFEKGKYANLAAAQADLAGTELVARLATPEMYDISHTITPLSSFDKATYIDESDGVKATVDLEYSVNQGDTIKSHNNQIAQLGNIVNELAESKYEPVITNAWVDFGVPFKTPTVYREANGWISISGVVKDGALDTSCLTLLEEDRSATQITFITQSGTGFSKIDVNPDGTVIIRLGTPASGVALDGIRFKVGE